MPEGAPSTADPPKPATPPPSTPNNPAGSTAEVAQPAKAAKPAKPAKPTKGPKWAASAKVTVAILSAATALLTLLSTALGVVARGEAHEKQEVRAEAVALAEQVSELSVEINILTTDVEQREAQVAALEREASRLEDEVVRLTGVVEQDVPGGVTSTPSAVPQVFLADERSLNSVRLSTGTAHVGGQLFNHSLSQQPGSCRDGATAYAEYDLGRDYDSLVSTIGLSDKNRAYNRTVTFQVIADNETLFESTISAGEAEEIDVPLAGRLRLRLETTFYQPQECPNLASRDHAVWGNATLVRR